MSVAVRRNWSVEDSAALYDIARWSDDYFHISDTGTLLVSPDRDPANAIDSERVGRSARPTRVGSAHFDSVQRNPG